MDYLDTLDAEVYLLDPPPTVWDRVLLLDHATWFENKDLQVLQMAAEKTREFSRDIPREAWLGLYASANPLRQGSPPGMAVVHSLFKRAEDLPEWRRLRMTAGMDPLAAVFGAAHFVVDLMDKLPPEVKEPMRTAQRAQDRVQDLQDQLAAAQSLTSGRTAGSPDSGNGGPGQLSLSLQQIEQLTHQLPVEIAEAEAQASAQEQVALEALDAAQARTRHCLAQAMNQSADSLNHLQKAADEFGVGWGLGASRGATREQIAGLHQLADFLRKSPDLRMILDCLGWAKALVTQERRKSTRGRQSFTHYKVQDLDLDTLAPDELMSLIAFDPSSPIYLDFLCRALDGSLLHAQFEGEDYAGRGPIVFLRDESGSMGGWRRATACALQLALMVDARKEGRRFVSIPFSDIGEFEVYDPGPRPDPAGLIQHLERTYGHGTEPYEPLKAAVQLIRDDPSLKAGDILCLTDGAFGRPAEDFLQLLEEARSEPGLKVVAVVINGHPGQADFADKVVMVSDIVRERDRLAQAIAPLL